MHVSNEDIARYFNRHQIIYTLFWSRNALHCGFWYDDTKNLAEAIVNTDKFVRDVLEIGPTDTVLDAGCGVGGTCTYLAEITGACLEGVTLSNVQLKIAKRKARKSPAVARLNFSQQDFTKTNFKENTFSKVFGIESICYAHNKIDFLNEAYRIMVPGGRIAVIDLFLNTDKMTAEETKIYRYTIEGCAVPNLSTIDDFAEALQHVGFGSVTFRNMSNQIKKSSHKLYYRALPSHPFEVLRSWLPFFGHGNFTPVYQRAFFDKGVGTYGAFIASKP
jgi:cyclopropane fatty-acyl-phospholipid synthase-like methyltransferase